MIRTGYLRWEIDVSDDRSAIDPRSREITFLARPSYRVVRVKNQGTREAADRFVQGEETYDVVLRNLQREGAETDVTVPDVGPRQFRYSEDDRTATPRFWMSKLQREANAFAHELVRKAASFPQMVIASAALRAGYARLVEFEIFRVIEGRSIPQPTNEAEPMRLDSAAYQTGVPELVAAELVRDVVDKKEFDEFLPVRPRHRLEQREILPNPAPTARLDRGLGRQDPPPRSSPLRRLPGPWDAPIRRGRHEVPPRQAPTRPLVASRRQVQPPHRAVRRHRPPKVAVGLK